MPSGYGEEGLNMKSSSTGMALRVVDVQRDMELVRDIFRAIIGRNSTEAKVLDLDGYDPDLVGRHVEMLHAAGYIHGIAAPMQMDESFHQIFVRDLTWQGHEFAGAILTDDGVWQKVKAAFGPKALMTVPLKVVEAVATEAITEWAKARVGL